MKKIVLAAAFLFSAELTQAQLKINEYSCANFNTLADNFGEYEDWVEIYNPGSSAVPLSGFYLSDDAGDPTKFQFPSTSPSVPAGGVTRVWCSSRNIVFGSNVHTNFKLTQCKPEEIVLTNSSGNMVDSVQLRRNQESHSWGRVPDGTGPWAIFTTHTAGALNTTGTPKLPYASTPVFSVAAGFYGGAQNVTITSPDPGVTIYYTLDGSEPTTGSTVYASPVNISAVKVLRARAFSSNTNVPASFIESNTYFVGVTHTVSTISVYGDDTDDLLNGSWSVSTPRTGFEWFDKTGAFKAEVTGDANEHGNDSWAYDQRGFDFVARDQFGYNDAIKHKLFRTKNRQKFQRIILKAAANDNYPYGLPSNPAHIRDSYVHHMSDLGDLFLDERSWESCVLYVNGQYWGVYDAREKVDDADYTDYYYDQPDVNNQLQFIKTWGGTWNEYGGPQSSTDWNTLLTYINSNNLAVQANYDHVDSILNVKSLADYFILNSWAVTSDWLNWNTGWWRGLDPAGKANKWRYILWDNDACFGHYINYTNVPNTSANADPCDPESLPDPGGQGHTTILNKLMDNPGFKQYYINRYADLMNTTLSCDSSIALLNNMIAEIDPEMTAQIARWSGGTYAGWQNNVNILRTFIQQRCVALQQGMIDCYNLTGPYDITIDVAPAGAGTVDVNSLTLDNYPWSGIYYGGIDIILKATPANNTYIFDHWEMVNTPVPSTTADSITVNLTSNDNIVAHFKTNDVLLNVFIATAFSPNGDGNNEYLVMHGMEGVKNMEFVVYNRWGQRVFSSTDPLFQWDGSMNGQKLDAGVYAYKLTAVAGDGIESIKTGNITIMR